jgi:hypothetical protein
MSDGHDGIKIAEEEDVIIGAREISSGVGVCLDVILNGGEEVGRAAPLTPVGGRNSCGSVELTGVDIANESKVLLSEDIADEGRTPTFDKAPVASAIILPTRAVAAESIMPITLVASSTALLTLLSKLATPGSNTVAVTTTALSTPAA